MAKNVYEKSSIYIVKKKTPCLKDMIFFGFWIIQNVILKNL